MSTQIACSPLAASLAYAHLIQAAAVVEYGVGFDLSLDYG